MRMRIDSAEVLRVGSELSGFHTVVRLTTDTGLVGIGQSGAWGYPEAVAAIVSAPIAAYLFGGVTGSGTDLIVAALRQGGADVFNASLGQGLFSDPIDKTITSFVVFIVLMSLSPRVIARFPLGERTVGDRAESLA